MAASAGFLALGAAADVLPFDALPQDMLPGFLTGLSHVDFDPLAPTTPRIERLETPFTIFREGHLCTAIARVEMRAVILARRRYFFGPFSLSPVDLVAGWGQMSNPAVLRTVRIRLGGRDYEWEVRPPPRIGEDDVKRSCSNMHIIPMNAALRSAILSIRRNHIVSIGGFLCDVTTPEGETIEAIRASTTGGDRCFLLVDQARRLRSWEI